MTPLREKTNNLKEQGVKGSSVEHVKPEFQVSEMPKCFSKPVEVPRTGKLELPRAGNNNAAAPLEFTKCLTSTTAVLEPRLEFGLDDTRGL